MKTELDVALEWAEEVWAEREMRPLAPETERSLSLWGVITPRDDTSRGERRDG